MHGQFQCNAFSMISTPLPIYHKVSKDNIEHEGKHCQGCNHCAWLITGETLSSASNLHYKPSAETYAER